MKSTPTTVPLPNTKLLQLQRAITYNTMKGNSARGRQATGSGPECFGFERHIPTTATLQQLSIREETTFLTGQSESLHPQPTYVYTDALEICNTDWLGRTKTMTGQSLPWHQS